MGDTLVRTDNLTGQDLIDIANEIIEIAVQKRMEEEDDDLDSIIFPPDADECLSEFAYIGQLFADYTIPDPAKFVELKQALDQAHDRLMSDDAGHMNSTDLEIDDWSGDAFEAFEENYVASFNEKRAYHIEYAKSLAGAIEAYQKLWTEIRRSVYLTGHATKSALEAYEPSETGNLFTSDPIQSTSVMLTIIGAVVAAPVTDGLTLGYAVTAISAATTVADKVRTNTVEGSSIDEILASMEERLEDINDNGIKVEEDEIISGLSNNIETIDSYYNDLVPPEPSLASIDPSDTNDDLIPPGRKHGS